MQVLVNQLGYELETAPEVVVRCGPEEEPGSVRLESASDGAVVGRAEPEHAGHVDDWRDWVFWTATLPAPEQPGEYVVAVERAGGAAGGPSADEAAGSGPSASDGPARDGRRNDGAKNDGQPADVVRSRRFAVERDLVRSEAIPDVLSYFRVERCTGPYDRADRAATFVGDRDDAVDVSGGWYDASGDVSKYLSHLHYANYANPQQIPLVAWSLLDARSRFVRDDGLGGTLRRSTVEEACVGVDFLVRVHDDEGYFYTNVFDRWTGDPERREICAFEGFEGEKTDDYQAGFRQGGGVAVAALARASRLGDLDLPPTAGGEFDWATYRETAVDGFEHLQAHNEQYLDDGTENLLDDYCALLAATELAGATGEDRFVDAAADRVRSLLDRQTDAGWFHADDAGERPFFHATDEGLPIVALCRYLTVLGDDAPDRDPGGSTGDGAAPLAEDVRAAIRAYWDWELSLTDEVVNPFGYARQYARAVDEDEPSGRFFMPHENETGYWWSGENARLGSLAAAALATAEVLDDADLAADCRDLATDQLDWILGRNPFDVCMLEGPGRNPEPFMSNAPQTPGGIANGITAGVEDESEIAFNPPEHADDGGMTWRWTEQWLTHGAWFLNATARLVSTRDVSDLTTAPS